MIDKYIHLPTTNSTNEALVEYVSKNNPQGKICLYTYNQTIGRGQIGRNWFSDVDKNLTLSYYFPFTHLRVEHRNGILWSVALAIRNYVSSRLPENAVFIKWPNDIYIDNKKIAGILIQNQLQGHSIGSAIVGVGINVNQQNFPDIIPNPTSLSMHSGVSYNLDHELKLLEPFIIKAYADIMHKIDLRSAYEYYLFGKGHERAFVLRSNNKTFKGIIKGIDDEGQLLLAHEDASIYKYGFQEISFVI